MQSTVGDNRRDADMVFSILSKGGKRNSDATNSNITSNSQCLEHRTSSFKSVNSRRDRLNKKKNDLYQHRGQMFKFDSGSVLAKYSIPVKPELDNLENYARVNFKTNATVSTNWRLDCEHTARVNFRTNATLSTNWRLDCVHTAMIQEQQNMKTTNNVLIGIKSVYNPVHGVPRAHAFNPPSACDLPAVDDNEWVGL